MSEELPHPGALVEGRYRIVEKIGEGGHGVVYRARRDKLDRVVALKVVPNRDASDRDVVRLRREVFHASGLTNPHTVTVYDYGTTPEGHLYIAMEFLPGLNLGEWLAEHGALDVDRATDAILKILDSLAEAHRNGIVHRDLKPGNIIVRRLPGPTDRLEVKLLDFGLSKYVGASDGSVSGLRVTQEGRVYGTPQYMAPEQAVGDDVTPRADIYTVGLLGYEMVEARPAFAGDSRQTTMRRQLDEPLPELPDWVDGTPLAAFIRRCTRKAPEDRFENAGLARKWLADRKREFQRLDTLPKGSGTGPRSEANRAPGSAHGAATPPTGLEGQLTPSDISRRIADVPLIGRSEELERSLEWRDRATARGGILWLTGPPGGGKTRLLDEIVERLDPSNQILLRETFRRSGSPTETVRELFRPLVGGPEQSRDPEVPDAPGAGALEGARIELGLVDTANPAPDRRTHPGPMFQSLIEVLTDVAAERPILVVLDDFHHASGMAVGLIRRLARDLLDRPDTPVGLLLSGRSQELRANALIAELLDETATGDAESTTTAREVLQLEPLGNLAAQQLLDQIVPFEPALRETLVRHASGNPMYLAQIIRYLVEQDLLVRGSDHRYDLENRDFELDDLVPPSLLGLSRRRLRSLARNSEVDSTPLRVLTHMAILGDRFENSLLERMLDGDAPERKDDLDSTLATLRELDILRETTVSGAEGHAFTDTMFRKAILEMLDLEEDERRRLHRSAARTKVRHLGADGERQLSTRAHEIGRHLEKAAASDRAIEWYLRSASRLEHLGDRASALEDVRAAERLVSRGRPASRDELRSLVDIRLDVARLSRQTGKFGPAEDTLRAAREEAGALDDTALRAELSHRLADVLLQRADYDAARRYVEEAERLWEEADRPDEALRAALGRADVLYYRGEMTTARNSFRQHRERAVDLGADELEARALLGLLRCARGEGRLPDAQSKFDAILERADPASGLRAEAEIDAGIVELHRSGPAAALELLGEGLETARRHGDVLIRARAHLGLGMALRRTAQIDAASHHADRSRTLYERAAHRWGIGKAVLLEGELAWVDGDPERGAELANDSRKLHRDLDDVNGLTLSLSYEGLFRTAAGRSEEARELLMRALATGARSGLELHRSRTLLFLGMVDEAEHDLDSAFNYYVDAAETARDQGHFEIEMLAEMSLAKLELVRGDVDPAAETLRRYREEAQRRGYLYGVVFGWTGEAWVAVERGDEAAVESALEQLRDHLAADEGPDLLVETRLFRLAQLVARRNSTGDATVELEGLERLLRELGAEGYAHRLALQLRTISESEASASEL